MRREVLDKFLGKDIKVIHSNGFVYYGRITEVFDDGCMIHTPTTNRFLSYDCIKEIEECKVRW